MIPIGFLKIFRGVKQTFRQLLLRIVLIFLVIGYLLIGAFAYHKIEGNAERKMILDDIASRKVTLEKLRNSTQEFMQFLLERDTRNAWVLSRVLSLYLDEMFPPAAVFGFSAREIIIDDPQAATKDTEEETEPILVSWSFSSSLLFAFTAITTIGYGNIAPQTNGGRLFTIFYALIGIPLCMLVIADLGKFLLDGIHSLTDPLKRLILETIFGKNKEKQATEEDEGGYFLLVVTLIYIVIGALVCPLWERWTFFDGIYFSFVTLTTIGFGDIYPQNLGYLVPTLIYITIGLALTTMTIEVMGTLFKKVHYLGAKIKNVNNSVIWFGGKRLTVGELVVTVGKQYGISAEEIEKLNFDAMVEDAIVEKETPAKMPPMKVPEPPPPPPPPPPPREAPIIDYALSVSSKLAITLPAKEEIKKLWNATVAGQQRPFILVKVANIQEMKLPNRCRQCLIHFPRFRRDQKHYGLENMAIVHWENGATTPIERHYSITPNSTPDATVHFARSRHLSLEAINIQLEELAQISTNSQITANGDSDFELEIVHPWYQCLVNRHPDFSMTLLEIDPTLRNELDESRRQLLDEQLGIEDVETVREMTADWRLRPDSEFE